MNHSSNSQSDFIDVDSVNIFSILKLNAFAGLIILAVFSFLQSCKSNIPIYQPRVDPDLSASQALFKLSKPNKLFPAPIHSFFGWIFAPSKVSDKELLARSGLETYLYMKFQKYIIWCLGNVCFFSIILIFVNDTGSAVQVKSKNVIFTGFGKWTMANLNDTDQILWVHCIAFIIICLVNYYLVNDMKFVLDEVRGIYLAEKREKRLEAKDFTVLIHGLPRGLRDGELLKNYIEKNLYPDRVLQVNICYDTPKIWKLHKMWKKVSQEKSTFNCCFDEKENQHKLEKAQKLLKSELKRYKHGNHQYPTTGYGFVVFRDTITPKLMVQNFNCVFSPITIEGPRKSIYVDSKLKTLTDSVMYPDVLAEKLASATICQAKKKIHPNTNVDKKSSANTLPSTRWKVILAPDPKDIIWREFSLTERSRNCRLFLVTFSIWIIIIFGSFPIAFLSSLENLSTIQGIGFIFAEIQTLPKETVNWLQAYLPALILLLWKLLVPYLFQWMYSGSGIIKKTELRQHLIWNYFLFLFFSGVILPSTFIGTSSAMFDFIENFARQPVTQLLDLLTAITTPITGVFISYLIISTFIGCTITLLRLHYLIPHWCRMRIARTEIDRQKVNNKSSFPFEFHFHYPIMLLCLSISMLFAITIPVTVPFGLFYFLCKHWSDRYALSYIHPHPSIESTGQMFASSVKIFIWIQLLFQISAVSVFLSKEVFPQAAVAFVFFFLTMSVYYNTKDHLDLIFRQDHRLTRPITSTNEDSKFDLQTDAFLHPVFQTEFESKNQIEIKLCEQKLNEQDINNIGRIERRQREEVKRIQENIPKQQLTNFSMIH